MAHEIDPKESSRAMAFELWMKAPNPMVTFFKTFDVTNLVKVSKKKRLKFNMLLDYCIGRAAVPVQEFYVLPVGDKLIAYDSIAVNTIVRNKNGAVSSCDILAADDMETFNRDYLNYTERVAETCADRDLSSDSMVIGTSAIIDTELDGAVGMNSGIFNNPFMIWGKYRKKTVSVLPARILSISSYPDGRRAGRPVFGEPAEGNEPSKIGKPGLH